jgi:hypothetical protein
MYTKDDIVSGIAKCGTVSIIFIEHDFLTDRSNFFLVSKKFNTGVIQEYTTSLSKANKLFKQAVNSWRL